MAEAPLERIDPEYEGMFSDLRFDTSLYDQAGRGADRLEAGDARRLLRDRLREMFSAAPDRSVLARFDDSEAAVRTAAASIVAWLPHDAMYEDVVANLDLRPFMTVAAASAPDEAVRALATVALEGERELLREAYTTANNSNPVTTRMSDADLDAATERMLDADPGTTVSLRPTSVVSGADQQLDAMVASGQMEQSEANQQLLNDPLIGDLDPGAMVTFPSDLIAQAVYTGEITDILDVAAADERWIGEQESQGIPFDATTAFTPINLGPQGVAPSSVPGEFRPSNKPVVLNAIDAINYLRDLPPSKVASLQKSLARAGYMENDQGLTYEEGYAYDPLTRDAWRRALLDSVMRNQPIPQVLIEKGQEAEKRRQEMTRIKNEDILRSSVNGMALEAIGRELSDQEFDRLRGFIQHIGGQRADEMAQGRMPTVETYDGQLYGESDVMAKMDEMLDPERASVAGFNAGQAVWKAYGMDPMDPAKIAEWREANRAKWKRPEEDY